MLSIDAMPAVEEHYTMPTEVSFPYGTVSAILTDIEGTTTSISFVQDVLFPYAKQHVAEYVMNHQEELGPLIQEVKEIAAAPDADLEQVIAILLTWMKLDKKITPLKTLQGKMWENGYEQGDFQGHIYEDAYFMLNRWDAIPRYVYSSGSVHAQKLLFSHSDYGDLTPLFAGYFDTTTGPKKEKTSYESIAKKIGVAAESVLFLSDSLEELDAARAAGMQTVLLCRDDAPPAGCAHPVVKTFVQIKLESHLIDSLKP